MRLGTMVDRVVFWLAGIATAILLGITVTMLFLSYSSLETIVDKDILRSFGFGFLVVAIGFWYTSERTHRGEFFGD